MSPDVFMTVQRRPVFVPSHRVVVRKSRKPFKSAGNRSAPGRSPGNAPCTRMHSPEPVISIFIGWAHERCCCVVSVRQNYPNVLSKMDEIISPISLRPRKSWSTNSVFRNCILFFTNKLSVANIIVTVIQKWNVRYLLLSIVFLVL